MKMCSYCGKEYPDDAAVCAVDGAKLSDSVLTEKKATGVWRGVYGYAESKKQAGKEPVPFILKLKQGWMEHFTGSVTEDLPLGMPGTGVIDGYMNPPRMEFTKQMPVGYVIGADGVRRTLREYFIAKGYPCEHDLPSLPIEYQGTMLDPNRVQGIWTINPRKITLPGGQTFSGSRSSGFWCAQFMTADLDANPTDGPTEPLFDKGLLSPRELENVEGSPLLSVGKFNVPDAEKILKRFDQEGIQFEIARDDTPLRQMNPVNASILGGYFGTAKIIEIFVHQEKVAQAEEILRQGGFSPM